MSWLETLGDLASLGGISGAAHSYLRGQIITQAVRAGASANSILKALSGYGLGIRRTQGLAMVRGEQARQLAGATANQISATDSLGQLLGTTPPANWTGRYMHQVTVTYRTRTPEGDYQLHTRTLGIKSTELLSPETATQGALDIMNTGALTAEEGAYPLPSDILTSAMTGIWYDTQRRNLPSIPGGT